MPPPPRPANAPALKADALWRDWMLGSTRLKQLPLRDAMRRVRGLSRFDRPLRPAHRQL